MIICTYKTLVIFTQKFNFLFSFLHDVTEQNKMVRLHGDGAITYGEHKGMDRELPLPPARLGSQTFS